MFVTMTNARLRAGGVLGLLAAEGFYVGASDPADRAAIGSADDAHADGVFNGAAVLGMDVLRDASNDDRARARFGEQGMREQGLIGVPRSGLVCGQAEARIPDEDVRVVGVSQKRDVLAEGDTAPLRAGRNADEAEDSEEQRKGR